MLFLLCFPATSAVCERERERKREQKGQEEWSSGQGTICCCKLHLKRMNPTKNSPKTLCPFDHFVS